MKKFITLIYKTFTWLVYPFSFLISKIGKPEPLCDEKDLEKIMELAEPGDVLLSRENFRLSNWFIRGYYGHGAQFGYNRKVIESVPNKVRVQNVHQWVYTKDDVCLLSPNFPIEFKNMNSKYKNRKYDFRFFFMSSKLYCMELVYRYQQDIALGKLPYKPRRMFFGFVEYLTPDDLLTHFRQHYTVKYESCHGAR